MERVIDISHLYAIKYDILIMNQETLESFIEMGGIESSDAVKVLIDSSIRTGKVQLITELKKKEELFKEHPDMITLKRLMDRND